MARSQGTLIEVDDDELFEEKEWIGRGKKYDWSNLPGCVTSAKNTSLEIPEDFLRQAHVPPSNLSVDNFLSFELPRLSSEIISSKTSTWFSSNVPTADNNVLISWPVPSPEFINSLDAAYGQAWLDGAKSIVDQCFNDGTDHLPLWIISFWKEVAQCHKTQVLWKASELWLDREGKKSKEGKLLDLIRQVRQLLSSVTWNSKMSYCKGNTTTLHLTKLLGTVWLSDEHINMMIEVLLVELSHNPKSKTHVADLSFALKISKIHKKAPESQWYLGNFVNQVQEQHLEKLYFLLHVNSSHWIASMVDFKQQTFSFGKLISYLSSRFIHLFFRRFTVRNWQEFRCPNKVCVVFASMVEGGLWKVIQEPGEHASTWCTGRCLFLPNYYSKYHCSCCSQQATLEHWASSCRETFVVRVLRIGTSSSRQQISCIFWPSYWL